MHIFTINRFYIVIIMLLLSSSILSQTSLYEKDKYLREMLNYLNSEELSEYQDFYKIKEFSSYGYNLKVEYDKFEQEVTNKQSLILSYKEQINSLSDYFYFTGTVEFSEKGISMLSGFNQYIVRERLKIGSVFSGYLKLTGKSISYKNKYRQNVTLPVCTSYHGTDMYEAKNNLQQKINLLNTALDGLAAIYKDKMIQSINEDLRLNNLSICENLYQKAAEEIKNGKYEAALNAYTEITSLVESYKDVDAKLKVTKNHILFSQASSYEKNNNYLKSYLIYGSLCNDDYIPDIRDKFYTSFKLYYDNRVKEAISREDIPIFISTFDSLNQYKEFFPDQEKYDELYTQYKDKLKLFARSYYKDNYIRDKNIILFPGGKYYSDEGRIYIDDMALPDIDIDQTTVSCYNICNGTNLKFNKMSFAQIGDMARWLGYLPLSENEYNYVSLGGWQSFDEKEYFSAPRFYQHSHDYYFKLDNAECKKYISVNQLSSLISKKRKDIEEAKREVRENYYLNNNIPNQYYLTFIPHFMFSYSSVRTLHYYSSVPDSSVIGMQMLHGGFSLNFNLRKYNVTSGFSGISFRFDYSKSINSTDRNNVSDFNLNSLEGEIRLMLNLNISTGLYISGGIAKTTYDYYFADTKYKGEKSYPSLAAGLDLSFLEFYIKTYLSGDHFYANFTNTQFGIGFLLPIQFFTKLPYM